MPRGLSHTVQEMYDRLFSRLGTQRWWPGETPFEVCVGAILTQNTAWGNVERAIANLKKEGLLDLKRLHQTPDTHIATCIKPAGYFNIKTRRLRNFLNAVVNNFDSLFGMNVNALREKLLNINGIGPETADSMVLYAFNKPSFVVDAYTNRILRRHSLIAEEADYFQIKEFFESHLRSNAALYNEFHALLVKLGKDFCHKLKPKCETCPLNDFNGGPVV